MKNTLSFNKRQGGIQFLKRFVIGAISILWIVSVKGADADVSYYIFGRVYSVHQTSDEVESETIAAIPGVTVDDPESPNVPSSPVPFPGVTIEAYHAMTNVLLGTGQANREGFYNLTYMASEVNHTVRFLIYLDFVDGGREFVGEVNSTSIWDPIEVDSRLFLFDLQVVTEDAVVAGTAMFSSTGQYVFLEVGDVDIDRIYDEQQDPADSSKWGKTKPPSPGHSMGPDFGFGRTLELYGIFGETSIVPGVKPARYYKISYTGQTSGTTSGTIDDELYKKNYVIVGTGVEVYRILMGPKDVTIGSIILNDVYELDERLAGEPIPGYPGKFHSPYWTELGMRAKWNTRGVPDGKYELTVEAWDEDGTPLPPAIFANNYATLSLHLMNTPPESRIHNLQYLNGDIVLSDAAPCQTVILNKVSSPTYDDNLQFEITARHPTSAFFWYYTMHSWMGHDDSQWDIGPDYTERINYIIGTPVGYDYVSCAYRFLLRVRPRITNGYHTIYVRDNNWYVAISVHELP